MIFLYMNNIFLGHLPIELKLNSNQTEIQITPKYLPYDDDYFAKKYYADNSRLYICLEYEDPRHRFIKHKRYTTSKSFNHNVHNQYYLKYHTKFIGKFFTEITTANLGQTYSINLTNIYCLINKHQGYKFKIRATYRISYDSEIPIGNFGSSSSRSMSYNYSRTNVFSNEIELTLPKDNRS